jgi:hypothetical protein
MVPELVEKYIFLVQTFVEAGEAGLSLQQLQRKWEGRYNQPYPRRSFANHRAAVEQVFGLVITCDRSTNRYRIDQSESAVDRQEATEYLINTFTVNSLLSLGKERLSGRVSVEDIPSGQKYLVPVMQAMLDDAVMELRYHKYMSEDEEVRHIRPYAVKEYAKRWYIVAFSEEADALRVYAMDRIISIVPTGEKFKMPREFKVDEMFEASYGIYPPEDEPPVLVTVRTTPREAAYLKDLPIHPSQVYLGEDNDGRSLFIFRVIPNPDLVMELCKRGSRLEVLSPEALRQQVIDELHNALKMYE